ncbi:MAG: sulfite exporter TauE/SafE family protein [Prevotella sp.]|nr:sulfite exporter TauE/SafE family protein [Prevotella sp.]
MESIVIVIFLLSIGASFVQRTTGFGFGIFIMTMLPFFLPTYGEATTLSGLLAITTSAVIVWRLREFVTWQRLWPILLTFIIVSTMAIFALKRIEDQILRQILGVALILISIYFAAFSQSIKLPTTKWMQVGAGSLSGLMGGFFGMQGPPAVLYFIQSEPSKEHYMAMAQTYFLIGNMMMTIVRAYNGFLTTTVMTDYCFGLGGVIIGTCLGAFVFKHIPNRIFRYIVYAYIAVSGVIILLSSFHS